MRKCFAHCKGVLFQMLCVNSCNPTAALVSRCWPYYPCCSDGLSVRRWWVWLACSLQPEVKGSSHLCGLVVGEGTDILRWHFSREAGYDIYIYFFFFLKRKTFLVSSKKLSTFVLPRNWLLDIACSLLANLIESLFSLVIAS